MKALFLISQLCMFDFNAFENVLKELDETCSMYCRNL